MSICGFVELYSINWGIVEWGTDIALSLLTSFSPPSVISRHISPAMTGFCWHCCTLLRKQGGWKVGVGGEELVRRFRLQTSLVTCSGELMAAWQKPPPNADGNSRWGSWLLFATLLTVFFYDEPYSLDVPVHYLFHKWNQTIIQQHYCFLPPLTTTTQKFHNGIALRTTCLLIWFHCQWFFLDQASS